MNEGYLLSVYKRQIIAIQNYNAALKLWVLLIK